LKIFDLLQIQLKTFDWILGHILVNLDFEIGVDRHLFALIIIKILKNLQRNIFILLDGRAGVFFVGLIRL
jgi:hypothetical protein